MSREKKRANLSSIVDDYEISLLIDSFCFSSQGLIRDDQIRLRSLSSPFFKFPQSTHENERKGFFISPFGRGTGNLNVMCLCEWVFTNSKSTYSWTCAHLLFLLFLLNLTLESLFVVVVTGHALHCSRLSFTPLTVCLFSDSCSHRKGDRRLHWKSASLDPVN